MTLQTKETRELERSETQETPRRRVLTPRADVLESPDSFAIVAELPGVGQDSVELDIEKNVLRIRGSSGESAPDGYRRLYGEYAGGDYERKFALSEGIDKDGISATIDSGVLTVVLPKTKEALSKRIDVQSN